MYFRLPTVDKRRATTSETNEGGRGKESDSARMTRMQETDVLTGGIESGKTIQSPPAAKLNYQTSVTRPNRAQERSDSSIIL